MRRLRFIVVSALLWSAFFPVEELFAQGTPVISSFDPTNGVPGNLITIRGANFTAGTTRVAFNGVEAAIEPFGFNSSRFGAYVPTNTTTGPINVQTSGGQVTSTNNFTILNPNAPGVTGFSPTEGKPGASIQIDGTNLVTATAVKFNGLAAAFFVTNGVLFSIVPTNSTAGPIGVTTPEGNSMSAQDFIALKSDFAPKITNFSPQSGDAGVTSVTISGVNLTNVTSILFNGAEAGFSFFFGSLRATVPTNATSGPITVKSPDGSDTSVNIFAVRIPAPPEITSFSPTNGPAGTSVGIQGSHFVNVTVVRFGGIDQTEFSVFGNSILTTVPANAVTGPITVVSTLGSFTSADSFQVVAPEPPTISSFVPDTAEPDSTVEIRGLNLAAAQSVRFNGVPAASFNVLGDLIFAVVPANAVSGRISVTTPHGTGTSAADFTALEATAVTSFSPPFGPVGTEVELRGSGLLRVTTVLFNDAQAVFNMLASDRISTVVPTNATTGAITVYTATRTNTTATPFTVTNVPLPKITSFTPTNGMVGTRVEIRGTNLLETLRVAFSGVDAVFTNVSNTLVIATVPPDASTGPIALITPVWSAASASNFAVDPTPAVPPLLAIRAASATQIELSWPASAVGFALQANGDLGDGAAWQSAGITPSPSGTNLIATVNIGLTNRFFRLFHP